MKKLTAVFIGLLALSLLQCKDDCTKSDRCSLNPDVGPCDGLVTKYYYDKVEKKCKSFSWGGCAGVVPFDSIEKCEKGCNCD
jgi:hypothetical protein